MENKDKPAFPITDSEGKPTYEGTLENWSHEQLTCGLSKREYFAAMAMQGILSSSADRGESAVAKMAIKFADELLKHLES